MTTSRSLRHRLEKLAGRPTPPDTSADYAACLRLRAAIAAEFGVSLSDLFSVQSPALRWLHAVSDGVATPAEQAIFERIAAAETFVDPAVTPSAFLCAISRVSREF